MTHARAKIYAYLIRNKKRSIDDVADADRDDVRAAYLQLYGEEING